MTKISGYKVDRRSAIWCLAYAKKKAGLTTTSLIEILSSDNLLDNLFVHFDTSIPEITDILSAREANQVDLIKSVVLCEHDIPAALKEGIAIDFTTSKPVYTGRCAHQITSVCTLHAA
uniref:Uncharacterized protein n=1 Tax=Chromera velia CCMP2878 TaxID=1169474 RepID=A0A0G4FIU0_9ALVE|eukprot:Cvel_17075.t1-p1 / transcript=Cvel_17075.t1 / gene=Cvel_17075 / organism=Chromera_velia_CCMP2878 / gene_product=hypothetical protein / transcript_product=hypothetical protein / location=Cvel_scaffold1346:28712-29062(-) / protein_length=117 / sequence_SO=supercontig / SO=protein_coding / is_pseudo=false